MKYEYAYKTPDGVRHVEEMEAPSREAVFEGLRAKGIKAIKVVAKDGSKANGEVRVIGVKKRVAFASAILLAAVASVMAWWLGRTQQPLEPSEIVVTNTIEVVEAPVAKQRVAMPLPRQAIQGDRKRIENASTNLFERALEVELSRFAEPGRPYDASALAALATNETEVAEGLAAAIYVAENEFTEYIDLKRITVGLKREMKTFLRAGKTPQDYFDRLVKRQELEISYRDKAEKRLQSLVDKKGELKDLYDFWIKANAQLQSMGIAPLQMPDALRDYQIPFEID